MPIRPQTSGRPLSDLLEPLPGPGPGLELRLSDAVMTSTLMKFGQQKGITSLRASHAEENMQTCASSRPE